MADPTPEPTDEVCRPPGPIPPGFEDWLRRQIADSRGAIEQLERAVLLEPYPDKRAALRGLIDEHRNRIAAHGLTLRGYGLDPDAMPTENEPAEDPIEAQLYAAWQAGIVAKPRKKLREIGKPFGIANPDRFRQLLRKYAEPRGLPWTRNRSKNRKP